METKEELSTLDLNFTYVLRIVWTLESPRCRLRKTPILMLSAQKLFLVGFFQQLYYHVP